MRRSERLALALVVPILLAAETPELETPPASTPAQVAREALELEVRQAALHMLEADIQSRLEELLAARQELDAALASEEAGPGAELKTLIGFYQAMKPKNAAVLLERLPASLAADVLGAMSPRSAGKILNVMSPDRAVGISRRMAGESR